MPTQAIKPAKKTQHGSKKPAAASKSSTAKKTVVRHKPTLTVARPTASKKVARTAKKKTLLAPVIRFIAFAVVAVRKGISGLVALVSRAPKKQQHNN